MGASRKTNRDHAKKNSQANGGRGGNRLTTRSITNTDYHLTRKLLPPTGVKS